MWETLVNTGLITPSDFVRLSSTEAAKIFNLYPQKGLIAPGSDADIAIIDPAKEHVLSAKTHHSALDTSVYEGMKIKGKVSALQVLVLLHARHCGCEQCSMSIIRQSFLKTILLLMKYGHQKCLWCLRDHVCRASHFQTSAAHVIYCFKSFTVCCTTGKDQGDACVV